MPVVLGPLTLPVPDGTTNASLVTPIPGALAAGTGLSIAWSGGTLDAGVSWVGCTIQVRDPNGTLTSLLGPYNTAAFPQGPASFTYVCPVSGVYSIVSQIGGGNVGTQYGHLQGFTVNADLVAVTSPEVLAALATLSADVAACCASNDALLNLILASVRRNFSSF